MDKRICVTLLPAFLACGCVASSNFYSGRTLEEGKYSAGFAADDIALSSTDPDLSVPLQLKMDS